MSAHSVRWIDTHDACGSCRPKVCLREVVELQKQEKIHARNFWGRVPVRQGRSEVKQLLWLVLNIKLELARARSGSYPLSWNSQGEISRNLFGAPSNRALVYQQVMGK